VTTTTKPRPKTTGWEVGDVVQLGSARWIIRTITGRQVELDASNAPGGIWWTTTLNNLPEKEA
jgi:hypothetical protein